MCASQTGVYHYGGAIFAVILEDASEDRMQLTAEKLRNLLTSSHFLEGLVPLTFSVGMAVFEADSTENIPGDATELLHRAHSALDLAKVAGGARAVLWSPADKPDFIGQIDPLNGVFYRGQRQRLPKHVVALGHNRCYFHQSERGADWPSDCGPCW